MPLRYWTYRIPERFTRTPPPGRRRRKSRKRPSVPAVSPNSFGRATFGTSPFGGSS